MMMSIHAPWEKKAKDHCHVVYFSRLEKPAGGVYVEDGDIILEDGDKKINVLAIKDLKLMGAHNVENVLAAVGISYYMGVPVDVIRDVATSFKAVAHRIEYVDTVDGVAYYNDSKGTNPLCSHKGNTGHGGSYIPHRWRLRQGF